MRIITNLRLKLILQSSNCSTYKKKKIETKQIVTDGAYIKIILNG